MAHLLARAGRRLKQLAAATPRWAAPLGIVLVVAGGMLAAGFLGPASSGHPTVVNPASVAPARPAVNTASPPATGRPAASEIVVRPGDTLSGLAVRYGTTVRQLQELNNLGHTTRIYAGSRLRVSGTADVESSPARPAAKTATAEADTLRAPAPGRGAAVAIRYAEAQLGVPYRWAGTGNGGFDCSGLVMRAWQAAGVQLPRTAATQADAGTRISRGQLQPGDLVISNGFGHVQLYLGGGRAIEAPHSGAVVRITALPPASVVNAYVHIAD